MRAIVIGNITLDETLAVPALPRPGETVLAAGRTSGLGGKGANQAVLLGRAGIATQLVAHIGEDETGFALRRALAAEPVLGRLIPSALPTDRSIILLAPDGENCIVSTAACARAMTVADVAAALADGRPGDLLLMQGNLDVTVTKAALETARRAGMVTALNPAPVDPRFAALWPLVDLVVLNRLEAVELTGAADPEIALGHIRAGGAGRTGVTLGAAGAIMDEGSAILRAPAAPAAVRDTTGAGDTFTAVLAAALFGRGMTAADALHAAARAAAITVSRPGTLAAFPDAEALRAILGMG